MQRLSAFSPGKAVVARSDVVIAAAHRGIDTAAGVIYATAHCGADAAAGVTPAAAHGGGVTTAGVCFAAAHCRGAAAHLVRKTGSASTRYGSAGNSVADYVVAGT